MVKVRTKAQRTVTVQFLLTSPTYRITHAFHLNFRSQSQALPLRSFRQRKLRLPDLSGQGISSIQATALERFSVLALDGHAQCARNTGNTIVCKTHNQPQVARVLIAPNQRWPYAITNSSINPVKPSRKCLVVIHQVVGVNLVEVPKRPVIRANIHDVRDDVV